MKPIRIFQFRGLRAAALGAVFALGCSGESVVGGPTDAAADTAADTAADDLGVDAPSLDTPDASPDDVAADVLADDAADVVDVADTGPPGCARTRDPPSTTCSTLSRGVPEGCRMSEGLPRWP